MLLDEEEAEELVVRSRHRYEPGRGDGEEKQQAGCDVQPPQSLPVALDQDVECESARRQHDSDQPLGEHRRRHKLLVRALNRGPGVR